MPLESTVICVDNSEFMRNGDYIPNRLQAQQDAVNTVCRSKLLANPENNVGLLTFANSEVLATLTTDGGKILTSLHKVQPNGLMNFVTGIRIAHLALKHRQSKNHKMRIVAFVGSPIVLDEKEVVKLAKKLKKENVNVDIINFGETDQNQTLLEAFVNTINGREGTGSHLVTIPPSPHLSDALLSSPIIQGEDGTGPTHLSSGGGFDFGVDPNEDPELALALRVSMEEQRQRQQEEEKRSTENPEAPMDTSTPAPAEVPAAEPAKIPSTTPASATATVPASARSAESGGPTEEEMLQQALAMSMESGAGLEGMPPKVRSETASTTAPPKKVEFPDFSTMTEEEQIAYAMQISLQGSQSKEEPMEVEEGEKASTAKDSGAKGDTDFSEVMSDPAFLQDVLQSLPGVDPQSKVVRQAVGSLMGQQDKGKDKDKKDPKTDKPKSKKGDDDQKK